MPQQVWQPMPQQQKQPASEQQSQPTTMPQQVWQPAPMPQQQTLPIPIPHQPQQVWRPASMQQKLLTPIPQQPQQVWQPAPMPQQKKQPAAEQQLQPTAMPQKQPVAMPQQLWHLAQKQLALMSPQKHFESTEDGGSGSSQASIVEQSVLIPIYSYSSKSRYENGKTVFSQTRYTPGEAMPVDSGSAPKNKHVGIAEPSIYPPLVKDPSRKI
ncbi:gamma-gliadin-like [Coregonus clupeaformis]|uniref:gamma-gliadin-like n=1 Tax=Coregonus clupeaformis TaxID=59861 RepID=UPI001E1C826C|nr:gamma-gliadin-like [Coregonus clupeaformis]